MQEVPAYSPTIPLASVSGRADVTLETTRLVVEAVFAVMAVVDAYGKTDAVVEVAVKEEAVTTPWTTSAPRKSEEPATSKMLPVVVVAEVPRRKT